MKTELVIGEGFSLPLDAITETFGIVAKRGSGKTHLGVVMIEEMAAASLPFVAIDPLGVLWGLRASKEGTGPGIDIVIFGGRHGDIPIGLKSAAYVADFVIAKRRPVLLDLSEFGTEEREEFVATFLGRLYEQNSEPLHVFIDEADLFAPQKNRGAHKPMIRAMNDLVRRGRARGLGVTMITQRPAVIDKDILTQIEVLLVLRMTAPQDIDAIEGWVERNARAEILNPILASLPSLPRGSGYLWSPGWLERFERVSIRDRRTYDSSATPTMRAPILPTAITPLDLGAVRVAFETLLAPETEEEEHDAKACQNCAKSFDMREEALRLVAAAAVRNKELEEQLAAKPKQVPLLEHHDREMMFELAKRLDAVLKWATSEPIIIRNILREATALPKIPVVEGSTIRLDEAAKTPGVFSGGKSSAVGVTGEPETLPPHTVIPEELSAYSMDILGVLVRRITVTTERQISILAGCSCNSSTFTDALKNMSRLGFVQKVAKGRWQATNKAAEFFGHKFSPGLKGAALRADWYGKLWKQESNVLRAICEWTAQMGGLKAPSMDRGFVAERSGYSITSGTFDEALRRLEKVGLVTCNKVGKTRWYKPSAELFE